MPDLVLSTEKSLHRPLVVSVNGKEYVLEKIPKALFDKIVDLEKTGEEDAGYKQIVAAFGVPMKILADLDSRDVKLIVKLLTGALADSEEYLDKQSKKEPGSGKKS